jgi:hypothetical protein
MQPVQKVLLRFSSTGLPIFWVSFQIVKPTHVLSACYARYENIGAIKVDVAAYFASFARLQLQTIPYYIKLQLQYIRECHLRKHRSENAQTGGKKSRSTFELTAFISFGLTNVFGLPVEPGWHLPPEMVPLADKRFLHTRKGGESTKEKSTQRFMQHEVSLTTQSQGLEQTWR